MSWVQIPSPTPSFKVRNIRGRLLERMCFKNTPIPNPSAGLIALSLGALLHFFSYRMRVIHEILNDLTDYPKHDYRGIRGNRTGRKLGPDSDLLCPLQAKFTVAVPRTGGDTEVLVSASKWKSVLLVDLGVWADGAGLTFDLISGQDLGDSGTAQMVPLTRFFRLTYELISTNNLLCAPDTTP